MERPILDVLRDFAQPFLELGQSNGAAPDSQAALAGAALIWDLASDGLTAAQIVALVADDRPEAAPLVEALVRRKQLFFADDRRRAIDAR